MAQTMKEILRDSILTQMQPHISGEEMDMLNQAIAKALFNVDEIGRAHV